MRIVPEPGKGFPFLMGVFVLALLQGCLFQEKKSANPDYRRFYVVTVAGSPDALFLDSTYRINWIPINGPAQGLVSISLYQENRRIWTLDSSAANNGEYAWNVSKTKKALDYKLGLGGSYRIKVASVEDTGAWDFCPYFSLLPSLAGSLVVTTPERIGQVISDRELKIAWTTTLDSATRFGIQLFKDTALAARVSDSVSGRNSFTWPKVASPLGEGPGYRFRVFSVEDPSIEAYGPEFVLMPAFAGGLAIVEPKEGDALGTGISKTIRWTYTGKPGTTASLDLQCDSTLSRPLAASVTLSNGSTGWYLAQGYPGGERCRIRIRSIQDTSILAYSGYFSIQSPPMDAYEEDGSLSQAKAIEADGVPQQRTLTGADTDWIRIAVTKGARYLAPVRSSSIYMDGYLADSAGKWISRYSSVMNMRFSFDAAYTGNYHFVISPTYSHGRYEIAVARVDSGKIDLGSRFINPDSNTTWTAGSSQEIQWNPDTLFFPGRVFFSLYLDTAFARSMTSYDVANSGRYSWPVPAGTASSNRYRVGMENSADKSIRAFSPFFAIKGIDQDAYEPDNTKPIAKDIPVDGKPQTRSLSLNDTDWVGFDAVQGKRYLVLLNSIQACTLQVFNPAGILSHAVTGTSPALTVIPNSSGRYHVRIRTLQSTWVESYSLSVNGYVTGESSHPAGFKAPDSNTKWSVGLYETIEWRPDTSGFGATVRLALMEGNTVVQTLKDFANSSGTASFDVLGGLMTSGRYRIRISRQYGEDVFGYSDYFTINGISPDSLEPNDSAAAAKPLASGEGKKLSLHQGDADWFRFETKSQTLYSVVARPASTLKAMTLALYTSPNAFSIATSERTPSRLDSILRINWRAPADGIGYLRTWSNSTLPTINSGTYEIGMKAYTEPEYRISISAPTAGATVAHNDSLLIQWASQADSVGTITVRLGRAGSSVQILYSGVKGSGAYPWKVSPTLVPGSGYSITVARGINGESLVTASGEFSISASP